MVAVGRVRDYSSDTTLCQEWASEKIFYILLDGHVVVTKAMEDMHSRVMKKLRPGDFFGEMALIHNMPRSATVTTLTPVSVLEIHKEDFNRLLEHCTPISFLFRRWI